MNNPAKLVVLIILTVILGYFGAVIGEEMYMSSKENSTTND